MAKAGRQIKKFLIIACAFMSSTAGKKSRTYVGHCLSGLSHFMPDLKGFFKASWRLYGAWPKLELPARAPPIPRHVLHGLAGHAIMVGNIALGVCLLIFFECFVRTGELLAATLDHFAINGDQAVWSLPNTKSGQRTGALEAVQINNPVITAWLAMWRRLRTLAAGPEARVWP